MRRIKQAETAVGRIQVKNPVVKVNQFEENRRRYMRRTFRETRWQKRGMAGDGRQAVERKSRTNAVAENHGRKIQAGKPRQQCWRNQRQAEPERQWWQKNQQAAEKTAETAGAGGR